MILTKIATLEFSVLTSVEVSPKIEFNIGIVVIRGEARSAENAMPQANDVSAAFGFGHNEY